MELPDSFLFYLTQRLFSCRHGFVCAASDTEYLLFIFIPTNSQRSFAFHLPTCRHLDSHFHFISYFRRNNAKGNRIRITFGYFGKKGKTPFKPSEFRQNIVLADILQILFASFLTSLLLLGYLFICEFARFLHHYTHTFVRYLKSFNIHWHVCVCISMYAVTCLVCFWSEIEIYCLQLSAPSHIRLQTYSKY